MSNDPNGNINLETINASLAQPIIHYDPQRVDYAVSEQDINALQNSNSSIWKDVFLSSVSLGIATLVNGIVAWQELETNKPLNLNIFINLLVGCVCLILSIISLIVWLKNNNSSAALVEAIKSKPAFKLPS